MLKGRRAIVTGSTGGIGAGYAWALAAQGCSVMLNGFGDPEEIERQRGSMAKKFGVEVLFNGADLSNSEACVQLVRDAEKRLGGVDILINNAGIQHVALVEDFPVDRWNAIIAINLSSAFHTIRAALPCMKVRKWGRIINTASVHGLVASTNKAAYVAAKHGIVGLTKVVALENAQAGVTCNAICPGWVLTPLVEKQIEAIARERGITLDRAEHLLLSEKEPSLRFTTVEQLGSLAVFLCSEAASNITGITIAADGGWTAQ